MGAWTPGPDSTAGNDLFVGDNANDVASGSGGDDTLHGGNGDDYLNGGLGTDILYGEAASDTLVAVKGQIAFNEYYDGGGGGGVDTLLVYGDVAFAFVATLLGMERLTFVQNAAQSETFAYHGLTISDTQFGTGLSRTAIVTGSAGVRTDSLTITSVNEVGAIIDASGLTLVNWDPIYDVVSLYGYVGNDRLTGTAGRDNLSGGEGSDTLYGGAGNDVLSPDSMADGDGAVDHMFGGAGDDQYGVFEVGDVIHEDLNGGQDYAAVYIDYVMPANLESINLYGGALIATGNSGANSIGGNELNNVLSGAGGPDSLSGSGGNDTLNGGSGADGMDGGEGDDLVYVDNVDDWVYGGPSQGYDIVRASVSYTISGEIEELALTGTAAINATGNDIANRLIGNVANNVLDGAAGADTMIGGAGDDTYYVDKIDDSVLESSSGGGYDKVFVTTTNSTETYSLASNIEELILLGSWPLNGVGNGLGNRIEGNSGANKINGGTGADTMIGGAGDDTYYVDNVGDVTTESAGGGIDWVRSTVSRSLGANIENIVLTGSASVNATGNALANEMVGNAGANVLKGQGGVDTLTGGAGADAFVFDTAPGASNRDTITDFNVADDTIRIENSVYTAFGAAGVLAAGAFYTGAAAHDASDRIIYNSSTGALLYDSDGTGVAAAVQFATLSAGLALTNADFLIV